VGKMSNSKNVDNQNESLQLENSMDLLLVLLYSPGEETVAEPIDGITRLQKLYFLLKKGEGPETLVQLARDYSFKPYKMGPFSEDILHDIDELIAADMIQTEKLTYHLTDDNDFNYEERSNYEEYTDEQKIVSKRFKLTEKGEKIGKELWDKLEKEQQQSLIEFKSFFNSLSLRQLLVFVYDNFPEYTEESVIKDRLN